MSLFFIAPCMAKYFLYIYTCIQQTFLFDTWYPIQNQKWTMQQTDHKFGFSSHSCMSDRHLNFPKSAILVHVKVGSQATTSRLFNLNIQGFCFLFDSVLVVETHGGRNILVLPFSCLRQSHFPWAKLDVNKLLFWTVPTTKHLQKFSHCKLLFDPIIQLVWISKLECTRYVMTIIMGATSPTSDSSWKTVNLIKSSLCCFIEAPCSRESSGSVAAKSSTLITTWQLLTCFAEKKELGFWVCVGCTFPWGCHFAFSLSSQLAQLAITSGSPERIAPCS